MTKNEVFKLYNIDISHSRWDSNDDEYAARLFNLMNGRNPEKSDMFFESSIVFLNNVRMHKVNDYMRRDDYGGLYIVAKRIIYKHFNIQPK